MFLEIVLYPLKSLKNLIKSFIFLGFGVYLYLNFLVIGDYLKNEYGDLDTFFCSYNQEILLSRKTLRIVGGNSEGSGFFIHPRKVVTNFHVIDRELSPKIILPSGIVVTPNRIVGNKEADLAVLEIETPYDALVMPIRQKLPISVGQPVMAAGYPLGTELAGVASVLHGTVVAQRRSTYMPVEYVQTDINLVSGMSGGPLVDRCQYLVGVNTMGLSGLSLFVSVADLTSLISTMTEDAVAKINVDPSKSPADAVYAFYTYLSARRMQDGFNVLSQSYQSKTSFEEWTSRFTDILDVSIYQSVPFEGSQDTVFVKFSTKNWVEKEVEHRFYEGTWKTVKEDNIYKMDQSKIVEITSPNWEWYYR